MYEVIRGAFWCNKSGCASGFSETPRKSSFGTYVIIDVSTLGDSREVYLLIALTL